MEEVTLPFSADHDGRVRYWIVETAGSPLGAWHRSTGKMLWCQPASASSCGHIDRLKRGTVSRPQTKTPHRWDSLKRIDEWTINMEPTTWC